MYESESISLKDVQEAEKVLKGVISPTPVKFSSTFSLMTGNSIYLKAENLQKTGSFKIRGAFNKLYSLSLKEKKRGVVAASAGNHAQGVALAAGILGIAAVVVMPENAPLSKISATQGYGAKVLLSGKTYSQAEKFAVDFAKNKNMTLIHPFNDVMTIVGQGTIGLEILREVEDVEVILVPVGGGGLISGIALAVKKMRPEVQVVGVQTSSCPILCESFRQGRLLTLKRNPTMADGIAVETPGNIPFELIKKYVDNIITVEENDIAQTILLLMERARLIVEGAGAVGLTALLSGNTDFINKKLVVVLSGGNIDVTLLARIIDRGLARSGRLIKFTVAIKDAPGSIKDLLELVALKGANVMSIRHNRLDFELPVDCAEVELTLETRDREHSEEIVEELRKKDYI
ncbi:threonine ammonia-lyase [Candidatus Contubernalis alkaliaceticus]|uniref:threonine ammonia-lyase n=1 Tax=Candidatus Contubernalis alkaliaceticus TaxID=338645 RepID=UPI001F4C29B6|nr:threonine ammonia-lyase [Candidatus Contubernalis alkalaceticus]UNC90695.1 threonine ammonia-lyase [Candidatus Contubernalis alkalaceticus]